MLSSASTLMHPIEARNHAKSGFFPTDLATSEMVLSLFEPSDNAVNLLDPCCGEGEALSQFTRRYPNARTYGIELDAQRSEQAQAVLNRVYYADMYDVSLGRGQFDLLFLNPPYGNDMADKLSNDKTQRLEHKFLTQTFPALKANGVLVYIVPEKSIDAPRIKWLLARFKDLTIRKAAVDTYKQVVVTGVKLKQQRAVNAKMVEQFTQHPIFCGAEVIQQQADNLNAFAEYDTVSEPIYRLPGSAKKPKVTVKRLTAVGVAEVISSYSGQWAHFATLFADTNQAAFRQPLHALSDWHLALLITSGAVQGVVDNGKRRLLVKGATKKLKQQKQTQTVNEKTDTVTTIIEAKDRFSAQIKAIDIDETSQSFGEIITIK